MPWRPLDIGDPKVGPTTVRVPTVPKRIARPKLGRIGGLAGIAKQQSPTRGFPPAKPMSVGQLMRIARPR